jgi:transposase-like protein
LYVLWEVFSGTPISGILIERANEKELMDWLKACREQIGDLAVLALLSDKESALVAALRAVWPAAAHQLCQMHFMQNLSGPVHNADQELRGNLRDRLSALPAVPELEAEEAAVRIEQLVSTARQEGEKREATTLA